MAAFSSEAAKRVWSLWYRFSLSEKVIAASLRAGRAPVERDEPADGQGADMFDDISIVRRSAFSFSKTLMAATP
ncbi:hypothetical protein [Sphingomonas quercus]|uniref:hypothetical protein n=1 Tax=Sphingomonas quercus TaxID=2842451 RepID=UPI00209A8885|nr:hypothetical protein [Sphingomonas quercus]